MAEVAHQPTLHVLMTTSAYPRMSHPNVGKCFDVAIEDIRNPTVHSSVCASDSNCERAADRALVVVLMCACGAGRAGWRAFSYALLRCMRLGLFDSLANWA